MGRQASNVALECALQSHPNMVCSIPCVYNFKHYLSTSKKKKSDLGHVSFFFSCG
jgi:6-phosphofructokinase